MEAPHAAGGSALQLLHGCARRLQPLQLRMLIDIERAGLTPDVAGAGGTLGGIARALEPGSHARVGACHVIPSGGDGGEEHLMSDAFDVRLLQCECAVVIHPGRRAAAACRQPVWGWLARAVQPGGGDRAIAMVATTGAACSATSACPWGPRAHLGALGETTGATQLYLQRSASGVLWGCLRQEGATADRRHLGRPERARPGATVAYTIVSRWAVSGPVASRNCMPALQQRQQHPYMVQRLG